MVCKAAVTGGSRRDYADFVGLLRSSRPKVADLARRGDVNGLRDALRYGEVFQGEDGREWDQGVDVRVEAAAALTRFEPSQVVADLTAALDDRAAPVRLAAVEAIAQLGSRAAGVSEALLDCAVSRRLDNEQVADRALEVLIEWDGTGAARYLTENLLEPDAPALDEQHRDAFERLLETDARGSLARDEVAERLLRELHESSDERSADRAEVMLAWLGGDALERVMEALENGTVVPGIVRAAGLLGDGRAATPVVAALESPDPDIRVAAAEAARELNHTQTVPALLTATQDGDQAVRDAASAALDRMGTAAVIAGLAAVVDARGLLAVDGAQLVPVDGEALEDGEAAQIEPVAEADGAPAAGGAPGTRPTFVAEPAPQQAQPQAAQQAQHYPAQPQGAQPAQPQQGLTPAHPYAGGRRRGGLLDRIFGTREY